MIFRPRADSSPQANNCDIMEEHLLRLTNSVYKILEFFPESDPLKNRAKEKALAILENPNKGDIDMLLGYLWIAKTQGWLNAVNFLIVSNGYEKVSAGFRHCEEQSDEAISNSAGLPRRPGAPRNDENQPKEPIAPILSDNVSPRQKQILDFLDKNKTAQVMDLQTILPNITKRTIRRDLDELLLKDRIVRIGEFNQVVYKVKR